MPSAGTALTRTVLPEELVQALKLEYVAPLVLLLCSDQVPDPPTGLLFEVASGWQARTRWQRSSGYGFPVGIKLTPETVIEKWSKIFDFNDGRASHPESIRDRIGGAREVAQSKSNKSEPNNNKDYLAIIENMKNAKPIGTEFSYNDKDVILYNLSLGAKRTQLPLVYENNDDFQVLPTYGVIPVFFAKSRYTLGDLVPNFSPTMILHGEQYLEIRKFPVPTAGRTVMYPHLLEVVDKGNACLVVQGVEIKDATTGEDLFYSQSTLFLRGSGGFGGVKKDINRGAANATCMPPKRTPDVTIEEKTTDEQAALYRLNGDRLPLHIDPEFRNGGCALEIAVFTLDLQSSLEYHPPFRAPDNARSGAVARPPCVLIFTSGTTGLPKAAIVPWTGMAVGAGVMGHWIGLRPVTSKKPDRYYTAMPLYHTAAFQLGFHCCLSCPCTLVLGRKFSVSNFWDEVAAADATVIHYVGETLRYLLAAPPRPDDRVKHHVRLALGNSLRPDVWDRFRDRFGVETIAEFYGATESVAASFNLSRNTFSSGAVGQVGLIGELHLSKTQSIVEVDWETEGPRRDPKTGFCVKVPRGKPGELLYAVDPKDIEASYQGYHGNRKASDSKIWRDVHKMGDAWFRSGDVVRFDMEGRRWFSDRIGDTFRWHSENVSTAEVARTLGQHPAIVEANVYGIQIPNHDGRAGCAAVLLKDVMNSDSPVPESVLESLATCARKSLPKYAVPVFLRVVGKIMMTGTNKQLKHVLRAEGVEPGKVGGDRIFYLRPGSNRYEPFGSKEWNEVEDGKAKL